MYARRPLLRRAMHLPDLNLNWSLKICLINDKFEYGFVLSICKTNITMSNNQMLETKILHYFLKVSVFACLSQIISLS